jgi:hypothetical protein
MAPPPDFAAERERENFDAVCTPDIQRYFRNEVIHQAYTQML